MKVLTVKPDAITVGLEDGQVVIVKEKEFVIFDKGSYPEKTKVGYEDAKIMSITLNTIFADVFEELKELREKLKNAVLGAKEAKLVIKNPQ
jgi:hypothetical protein